MTANKNLLRMKFVRVIEAYAVQTGVTFDVALGKFYGSKTYEMMRNGVSDMHCMSVPYIVQEIIEEDVEVSD